jgi:hypothetical protein
MGAIVQDVVEAGLLRLGNSISRTLFGQAVAIHDDKGCRQVQFRDIHKELFSTRLWNTLMGRAKNVGGIDSIATGWTKSNENEKGGRPPAWIDMKKVFPDEKVD